MTFGIGSCHILSFTSEILYSVTMIPFSTSSLLFNSSRFCKLVAYDRLNCYLILNVIQCSFNPREIYTPSEKLVNDQSYVGSLRLNNNLFCYDASLCQFRYHFLQFLTIFTWTPTLTTNVLLTRTYNDLDIVGIYDDFDRKFSYTLLNLL